MRTVSTRAVTLALTLLSGSCVVGGDADSGLDSGSEAELTGKGSVYSRVVVGRLYQTEQWMLPAADTYQAGKYTALNERRIHYVCDALVKLDPTYVSGLVRLSWDTIISSDMREIFRGVKTCVRGQIKHPVAFDVVLNAEHYTDPKANDPHNVVHSLKEGSDRLHARLTSGNAELAPDIWFFDFYTKPFNDGSQPWFKGAMTDGIGWIHNAGLLVGGNVWGRSVPPHTDFAAIPLTGGLDGTMPQITALASDVPTFIHVRNDPQVCDSEGLAWFRYSPERKDSTITNVAKKQADLNVGYMYPLFFPLSATGTCKVAGEVQVAYDAAADGMLARIKSSMDQYQYRPRAMAGM